MSDESVRLFYALWPDRTTADRLELLQQGVRGRLTHHDDFHVTLVFLGNRSPALIPMFVQILHRLPVADIVLDLDRLGYFVRNRVAWAGMTAPPPALFELQNELKRQLIDADIPFQDHAVFKPHITLARNADAPDESSRPAIAWRARTIVLAESARGAQGNRYRAIAQSE